MDFFKNVVATLTLVAVVAFGVISQSAKAEERCLSEQNPLCGGIPTVFPFEFAWEGARAVAFLPATLTNVSWQVDEDIVTFSDGAWQYQVRIDGWMILDPTMKTGGLLGHFHFMEFGDETIRVIEWDERGRTKLMPHGYKKAWRFMIEEYIIRQDPFEDNHPISDDVRLFIDT